MVKLKRRIKKIDSLPPKKKNFSIDKLIFILITIIILMFSGYITYVKLLPYINSVNINRIKGKKVYYSDCNTKDYVIINKDKSYSLSITDDECNTKYYEGNVIIKYREITFNKILKGLINDDYNIIINDKTFEAENE